MNDKVYLETDEEITSAIDKVASATSSTVYVLVPRRASIVQSIVNLKLLQRQASLLKKKVILVTTDAAGRGLARKAGLATQTKLSNWTKKDKAKEGEPVLSPGAIEEDDTDVEQEDFLENNEDIIAEPVDDDTSQKIELGGFRGLSRKIKQPIKESPPPEITKEPSAWSKILAVTKQEKESQRSVAKKKSPEPEAIKPEKSHPISPKKSKKSRSGKVFLLPSLSIKSFSLFFITSLVVLGVVFFLVLPKAEISLVSKTEPFSTSFDLVVSQNISSIDSDKTIIPGTLVSAESKSDKKKFAATGEKEVGDKARGQVTFYNSFSSESQSLPAATQIMTNGLIFVTLQDVVVPGAQVEGGEAISGQVKVRVEAETPGDNYNIGASRFVITSLPKSKQSDIYGKSTAQFTGGSSQKVKVASIEDLDHARDALFVEAVDEAIKELEEGWDSDKMLVRDLLEKEIVETESSVEAETEGDDFEMKVTVKVSGFAFQKDDLAQLLSGKFDQLLPSEKYVVDQSVAEGIAFERIEQDFGKEEALTTKVVVNKEVAWQVNEQKIKRDIKGKSEQEAKDYILNDSNIISVEISFWPFWVNKVPKTEKKIEIMLDKDRIVDSM
ncbi:MAG: hypothetical protein HQ530_03205 [Parcubacteria group bacterium]|nr:hypothetical protein [Parcubacteria group bacterium]